FRINHFTYCSNEPSAGMVGLHTSPLPYLLPYSGGFMSVADRQIGVPARSRIQAPVMHTVLSAFSSSFETSMRPLLEPLQEIARAVAATPEDTAARRTLPKLRELSHQ